MRAQSRRHIDIALIPDEQVENLSRTILSDVIEFFKDPQQVSEFEAWRANRSENV